MCCVSVVGVLILVRGRIVCFIFKIINICKILFSFKWYKKKGGFGFFFYIIVYNWLSGRFDLYLLFFNILFEVRVIWRKDDINYFLCCGFDKLVGEGFMEI